jgi:preprotein translocase subunit SecE
VNTSMVDNGKDGQVARRDGEPQGGPLGWWARSREFLARVREEMTRVTWPSQREVQATTIVVIIFSTMMGLYLFAIDAAFNKIVEWIFRRLGGLA